MLYTVIYYYILLYTIIYYYILLYTTIYYYILLYYYIYTRGQGNVHFPCSADHEQDWQPYPVDPYSAICDDHTYIHTYILLCTIIYYYILLCTIILSILLYTILC